MTMMRNMPVQCPDCGREGSAAVYETVNVSLDATLKDRLLSGELVQWRCQGCGTRRLNVHPLLYHDMDLALIIQWISAPYAPTPEALVAALPSETECAEFKKLRSDYRFRVVREFDDLVEKIRIFDAGLDDRAVEWEKCLYSRLGAKVNADQQRPNARAGLDLVEPRFRRCLEVDGERRMEFAGPAVMRLPGLPAMPLTLVGPESLYRRAVQHLDRHLPWPQPVKGDFLLVDQEYVRSLWSRLPDIGERQHGAEPGSPEAAPPQAPPNPAVTKPWWKLW